MQLTREEMRLIKEHREKENNNSQIKVKVKKQPFLIRVEFSKLLTVLCIVQAQLWTSVIMFLSIKYCLDSILCTTLLGLVFVGENIGIACYFNKTKLFNAVRLKTESVKEIYKITNDKNKAMTDLLNVENITDNQFNIDSNEDLALNQIQN